jgi:2-hydroxychromene-2-carboxylate isomerase
MARTSPRWYFSFRSPYSWLAYRDLLKHHPDVADTIEWLPFWEPDEPAQSTLDDEGIRLPYVPMSREKHLYILMDVRRLCRERGLDLAWPVDREPRWEVAHLAYLAAEEHGKGRAFIDAVYRLRWEEGRNISDPQVIGGLGPELDLNGDLLAHAHLDPAVRERGMTALRSLHRDGVFGVPFFICGFQKFWGVDRLQGFTEEVRSRRAAA